jgi:hypothetical protein
MRLTLFAAAAPLLLLSVPAGAQNSSAEPPVVAAPPPKTTDTPPPRSDVPATTPPVSAEPVDTTPAPVAPVVITPAPQTVPMVPVTIDPDAAYPEGFGDPADPFSNDMSLTYRQQDDGFDWGLLGLLGLLGLIPLFRNRGSRVVYVERDEDEPRRVVRRTD